MTMPNFLVIGAGKSGTTSLYYYLNQHPDIYMSPVKEPLFFAAEGGRISYLGPDGRMMSRATNPGAVTGIEDYRALFAGASGEKAIGEASPQYLYAPDAPRRIEHYVPEARLIAILRDPAERAYSAYLHRIRVGREPLANFAEALRAEEGRMRDGWGLGYHYKGKGFYHAQLSRYHELFGREQIRVYLYEDLKEDPEGLMRDVFGFLGVDDAFVPDTSARYNVSGVPREGALLSFVKRPSAARSALKPLVPEKLRRGISRGLRSKSVDKPPPLDPEVRRELTEAYREDVLRLEGLIGRDLSAWLR